MAAPPLPNYVRARPNPGEYVRRARPPAAAAPAGPRRRRGGARRAQNVRVKSAFLVTGVINWVPFPGTAFAQWPALIRDKWTQMNDALAEQAELIFYGNGNFSTLFQRVKLTNERGPDGRTHRGRGRETAPIQPDDIVSKVAKFSVETGKERRGRRMHFHSLVVVEHDVLVNTAGAWGLTMNKDAIKTAFNSLRLRILVPEARGGDIISRLKVDFIRSHDQVENYLLKDQISYTLRRLDAAKLKRLLEEEDEALNEVLEEEKTDGEQAAVIDSEANEDIGAITDLLKDLGL